MIFDKLAVNRMKKRWERAISQKEIISVKMAEDSSIVVRKSLTAEVSGRSISNVVFDSYKSEDVACKAMLLIVGNMKPGDIHYFESDWPQGETLESQFSPEVIANMIETNHFEKAEMKPNSNIDLYSISQITGNLYSKEFSRPDLLEVILRFTGPMKPGDVYHFKSSENE